MTMSERSASLLQIRPLHPAAARYDVAILGGGLAGLTLAIQLKRRRPETSIVVLEKREGPAPDAAFKVGESTVPSGSHYFQDTVGMLDHLEQQHIVKCGLRFWHPSGDNSDITRRLESGPRDFPPHHDFQIDRGRFENELARRARGAGVDLLQGCRVGEVVFDPAADHTVRFTQLDEPASTTARWVVDAAGRASLLKRQLGLSREVEHTINSSWLRLAGGLDIESFAPEGSEDWLAFTARPGIRQNSTNHLMGAGYWVWLIPLGSGSISIGVCADPRLHPYEEISELDRMLSWLEAHEPLLAAAILSRTADIQDFLRVQDFAYGVERAYSPDRWCLVGEAAAFSDPFYSPGSDFIGYGNMFATDVVCRDLDGEDVSDRIDYYDGFYLRAFRSVLARTENLYPTMGNPWVMQAKLGFDIVNNHSLVVLLMVTDRIGDYDFMRSVDADLDRFFKLNVRTQQMFQEWNELESYPSELAQGPGRPSKPFIDSINGLVKQYSDEELRETIAHQLRVAEAMAVASFHRAARALPTPPDPERPVNAYAISLRPEAWESDGLYGEPGLTMADALAAAPGFDNNWIAQPAAKA
jgi:flavin-dependent dehydrogenase